MGHLPAEIMAIIISYFVAEGSSSSSSHNIGDNSGDNNKPLALALAPYATVSRVWQQRIEAVTFAHIDLNPARLASPLAAQALTPDRVRRFVRSIDIGVVLPPYDEEAWGRREDDVDRAKNDGVFTEIVRRLFGLLAPATVSALPAAMAGGQQQQQQRVGVDTDHRPKIHLAMLAYNVSDAKHPHVRKFSESYSGRFYDILDKRYESSYLDLKPAAGKSVQDEAEALPLLYCVKGFCVSSGSISGRLHCTQRNFAPRALCLMASRMSGLERIEWYPCDNERRDIALRKRLRADFADALQALPSSLRDFHLYYSRSTPLDHSFQMPSILDEADGDNNNDKLSLALHKLSQRLVKFHLQANVGPEVLWPLKRHGTQDDDPVWPRMRDYVICNDAIAPSGQWRFRRPDYESEYDTDSVWSYIDPLLAPGDEIEDHFRTQIDEHAVSPLLLAASRAVRRMPALRSMHITVDPPAGEGALEVEYMVKGATSRHVGGGGGNDGAVAELTVECKPVFYPDEEVVQNWREAAEEHVGAASGLVVAVRNPWE